VPQVTNSGPAVPRFIAFDRIFAPRRVPVAADSMFIATSVSWWKRDQRRATTVSRPYFRDGATDRSGTLFASG
jgi:hypothetical protein